jgi:hypothetical protein
VLTGGSAETTLCDHVSIVYFTPSVPVICTSQLGMAGILRFLLFVRQAL